MSRIGRAPVTIPAGVTVDVKEKTFTVKGPKGSLTQDYDPKITISVEAGVATLTRADELKETKAKHGLYRALLQNMVKGVTDGFEKVLVVSGVGWKVQKQGSGIVLNVGFSHPVEIAAQEGITFDCPSPTEISIKGIYKVAVGQAAASIRAIRKPEHYHGYGIRYKDEVIERKEGKTAGK